MQPTRQSAVARLTPMGLRNDRIGQHHSLEPGLAFHKSLQVKCPSRKRGVFNARKAQRTSQTVYPGSNNRSSYVQSRSIAGTWYQPGGSAGARVSDNAAKRG